MLFVLNLGGLLTWVERKQSAIMQDRIGANRASILGLPADGALPSLADAIKMLTKEDFRPARADRLLFELAPFVSVFFAPRGLRVDPLRRHLRDGRARDPAAGGDRSTSASSTCSPCSRWASTA